MKEKEKNALFAEAKRCLRGLFQFSRKGLFYRPCLDSLEENILALDCAGEDTSFLKEEFSKWKKAYQNEETREIFQLYAIFQKGYPDKDYFKIRKILEDKDLPAMLGLFPKRECSLPELSDERAEAIRKDLVAEFLKAIASPDVPDEKKYDEEYIENLQWKMQKKAIHILYTKESKDYLKWKNFYGDRIQSLLQEK